MVLAVCDLMQDAYPELKESADRVAKTVLSEEQTIRAHAGYRAQEIGRCNSSDFHDGPGIASELIRLSGDEAFKLYDTFGMPLDFMQDAARDQGIAFDQEGFDRAMEEQKTAHAPPGKAQPSRLLILLTSNFPNPTSKAIAKRAPTAAKSSPSSAGAKARRNSSPARKAKSSSITRPSTPNPADRLAIADGSTATITTLSLPK